MFVVVKYIHLLLSFAAV